MSLIAKKYYSIDGCVVRSVLKHLLMFCCSVQLIRSHEALSLSSMCKYIIAENTFISLRKAV